MSWNKNTIVLSEIDSTISTLKSLNISFDVQIIGKVRADGLNDDYKDREYYPIRRLEYHSSASRGDFCKKYVMLEHIHRTTDCDTNDILYSQIYLTEEEPENWEIEVIEQND